MSGIFSRVQLDYEATMDDKGRDRDVKLLHDADHQIVGLSVNA
jgi:hypothetical protein